MMKINWKSDGKPWGVASIIVSVGTFVSFPLAAVLVGDGGLHWVFKLVLSVLFVASFPVGYVLAYVGKKKSEERSEAMKSCNVGAAVSVFVSSILVFSLAFVALQLWFYVDETAAAVTALVDTVLISGSLIMMYVRSKLLWFI